MNYVELNVSTLSDEMAEILTAELADYPPRVSRGS